MHRLVLCSYLSPCMHAWHHCRPDHSTQSPWQPACKLQGLPESARLAGEAKDILIHPEEKLLILHSLPIIHMDDHDLLGF